MKKRSGDCPLSFSRAARGCADDGSRLVWRGRVAWATVVEWGLQNDGVALLRSVSRLRRSSPFWSFFGRRKGPPLSVRSLGSHRCRYRISQGRTSYGRKIHIHLVRAYIETSKYQPNRTMAAGVRNSVDYPVDSSKSNGNDNGNGNGNGDRRLERATPSSSGNNSQQQGLFVLSHDTLRSTEIDQTLPGTGPWRDHPPIFTGPKERHLLKEACRRGHAALPPMRRLDYLRHPRIALSSA